MFNENLRDELVDIGKKLDEKDSLRTGMASLDSLSSFVMGRFSINLVDLFQNGTLERKVIDFNNSQND